MASNDTTGTFLLSHCKGTDMICTNLLIRVEASSNYCWLYFTDGRKMLVSKTLQWFELMLQDKQFLRVHRTHLVNTFFIRHYIHKGGGKLLLANGDAVDISRRKKASFLQNWLLAPGSSS